MTASDTAKPAAATQSRLILAGLGTVYLVLAVGGFVGVGFDEFGYEEPVRLFGIFGVSTLLNFVHTLLGVVALVAAWRGWTVAVAPIGVVWFTAMSVFGIVARSFGGSGDPLNLSWANVVLYLLSAIACGYVYALRIRAARKG
jgi:hypothetical protein